LKKIIVNADELGLTENINDSILKCHKEGIVTSATFMANGLAFAGAVKIAKENPSLEIGVHVNLTYGRPLTFDYPFIDKTGVFLKRSALLIRLFFMGGKKEYVEKEIRAQIEKIKKAGIEVTHIDSHQHIHLHPALVAVFVDVAKEYGVPLRCPIDKTVFEETGFLKKAGILFSPHFLKRYLLLFSAGGLKKAARKRHVITSDSFISPLSVYRRDAGITLKTYQAILDSVVDGFCELMCHPGMVDDSLRRMSRYLQRRQEELEFLSSMRLKEEIKSRGIIISSFKDMMREKRKIKILHVITRSIEGGAPENTFLTITGTDKRKYISALACGGKGVLARKTRGAGFECFNVSFLRKEINPFFDLAALIRLFFILRKRKFDIVHTHASKAGILGRLAAFMARTPVIVHTIHGFGFNDYQRPPVRGFFVLLERLCAKFTDKIIAVSSLNIEKARRYNIGSDGQFIPIHSGIVIEKYAERKIDRKAKRREAGLNENNKVVGMVAHVDKGKGHEYLVKAAETVTKLIPDARFLIIGEGKLMPKIRDQIGERGLKDFFLMLGTREDVSDLYHIMDVFVLPTLWEGLPRVIPEAMAAGLPIVTTPVDGIPEAIKDNFNGLLVPPRDPEKLARAIIAVLDDESTAGRLAAEARKSVDPDFSARKMVKEIGDVYDKLCREKLGVTWRDI
jgi:predicted glycoside hydrolase/deacetylase ChbG (UPF0249 family)